MAIKAAMVSLGCPKNQVDAEMMMATLKQDGIQLVSEEADFDVIVINTCGFIQSAKEEAIQEILDWVHLKQEGRCKGIVVTGCLAERYKEELVELIPEVECVLGIGSNDMISKAVRKAANGQKMSAFGNKTDLDINKPRVLSTYPYFAYLKIAEGCDNNCAYCAIPQIRGRFRSRTIESIVAEAKWLYKQGVRELVLVAQDTTRYGQDLYGHYALAELLKELCKIDFIWIRTLYCYPDKITDELIEVLATEPKLVKYLDIPVQHCSTHVLHDMNRPDNENTLMQLIEKLRARIPNIVLRTTLITGFPGETEEDFAKLTEFVQKSEFDHLGCFAYSEEENTKAAQMDQVDEEVRAKRAEVIMDLQYDILNRKNTARIGQTVQVVVEGYDKYGSCYFGRADFDAPDIDEKVFFDSTEKYQIGDFVTVTLTEVCDYDLVGKVFPVSL
jgi:ribosomal protein S12 methylthiotransferase